MTCMTGCMGVMKQWHMLSSHQTQGERQSFSWKMQTTHSSHPPTPQKTPKKTQAVKSCLQCSLTPPWYWPSIQLWTECPHLVQTGSARQQMWRHSEEVCWDFYPRLITLYIALFSASKQIHCVLVATDSEWVNLALHSMFWIFEYPPKWCTYSTILLLHSHLCNNTLCVHDTSMHQFTVIFKATYIHVVFLVYAGFSVSVIHWTLTCTTGILNVCDLFARACGPWFMVLSKGQWKTLMQGLKDTLWSV